MTRFFLLLSLLSGCATLGTFQNAETLGQGNWEVGIEPSMWGGAAEAGFIAYPHTAVSARVGVADRVDFGGRIGSAGIELTSKFGLTAPEAHTQISIAPSAGGFAIGVGGVGIGLLAIQIPVLVGIKTGNDNEVVVGPKAHIWQIFAGAEGESAGGTILSLGSSLGYSARLSRTVRLIPEVTLLVPVVAGASSADTSFTQVGGGGVLFQAGMGILIGSPRGTGSPR